MIGWDNSRRQVALQENFGQASERRIYFPLRGRITGVSYPQKNKGKMVFVHLYLYDGYPALFNVPVAHNKINKSHGEAWSPEVNDEVLVQFINGDINRPIVTSWVAQQGSVVVSDAKSTHPRYHRALNKCSELWDENGNVTKNIHGNLSKTIDTGNETKTLNNGNQTITLTKGNQVVSIAQGSFSWTVASDSTITVPKLTISGELVVTGNITSSGGNISSTTGTVADATGTLSSLRGTYNTHTHNETDTVTNSPNQTDP